MMEAMGVDRVVCVDLHCAQIQGFFGPRTPVDTPARLLTSPNWGFGRGRRSRYVRNSPDGEECMASVVPVGFTTPSIGSQKPWIGSQKRGAQIGPELSRYDSEGAGDFSAVSTWEKDSLTGRQPVRRADRGQLFQP